LTPPKSEKVRTRTSGEPGSGGSSARLSLLPPNSENPESWIDAPCGAMIEAPPKTVTTAMTDAGASGCSRARALACAFA
jgi:hypothetical protein